MFETERQVLEVVISRRWLREDTGQSVCRSASSRSMRRPVCQIVEWSELYPRTGSMTVRACVTCVLLLVRRTADMRMVHGRSGIGMSRVG